MIQLLISIILLTIIVYMVITVLGAKSFHPDLPKYRVDKINRRLRYNRDITDKIFDDTNPPIFGRKEADRDKTNG